MQPSSSIDALVKGLRMGNRTMLGRAITLVESTKPEHQAQAQELIQAILPFTGNAIRIGITGVPGAGKSTFIDAFGMHVISLGCKPAVLAIDPSSKLTKGSILGDKTRMQRLSVAPEAFIRPSPSAGALGGVAGKTRETILICEAAGFDTIIIETVGVGQSETQVSEMVDFFLLLMLAGAGDELQGMKRGIMEMADALVINKADGDNIAAAKRAAGDYKNALHLFPPSNSTWIPQVATCSAITGDGVADIWQTISAYASQMQGNGYWLNKRKQQELFWFQEHLNQLLKERLYHNSQYQMQLQQLEEEVNNGTINAYVGAWRFVDSLTK
jgi:LAO/AO transport system kinase